MISEDGVSGLSTARPCATSWPLVGAVRASFATSWRDSWLARAEWLYKRPRHPIFGTGHHLNVGQVLKFVAVLYEFFFKES